MMGRHSTFTQEQADRICEIIATTDNGLRQIAKNEGITTYTILKWLKDFPDFTTQYARAREAQADFLADQIIEISDDSSEDISITENGNEVFNKEFAARSKIRIDARKWKASKLYPKKYSDKIDVTTNGENINVPIIIDWSDKDNSDAETKGGEDNS